MLLGSLDKCDPDGVPQFFEQLPSTTYNMPPALLTLDYDTDDSNSTDDNSTDDIDDVINERKATIKVLSPDDVLTFGKYKGKTLREIHKEDPNYLTWVSQNANDFVIDLRSLNE